MKHPPGVESAFPKCDHCFCTFVHVHTHIHKHGSASDPTVWHTPLGVHPLPTARSHSAPRDTVSMLTEKTSIELQSQEGSRTLDACTHVNVHALTHACTLTHVHTRCTHTRAHTHTGTLTRRAHTHCTSYELPEASGTAHPRGPAASGHPAPVPLADHPQPPCRPRPWPLLTPALPTPLPRGLHTPRPPWGHFPASSS